MSWKTIMTTFAMVFLAELGDKTQLATMMLTAQYRSPWAVFLGAAAALAVTSLLGVVFGEAVTRVIPEQYIRGAAGIAFIILGMMLVGGKL